MRCVEVDINAAEDIRLLSDIRLDNKVYPKGYALTKEDIIIFKMNNIHRINGIFTDSNDIDNRTALGIIAAKLCGKNAAYTIDDKGVCQMVSSCAGVFMCSDDRVSKFNRLSENIILNISEPYRLVSEREVIACIEITVPFISQSIVDDIVFKLSGNMEMISVAPLIPRKASLIYAKRQGDKRENKHFTDVVKCLVKSFSPLQINFSKEYETLYEIDAVAETLQNALESDSEVIFVLGASPSVCREDVLPSALYSVTDDVFNWHIPQVGAGDLIIARKRGRKIIVLPNSYDKVDKGILNRTIKQALFSENLTPFDFVHSFQIFIPDGEHLDENTHSPLIGGHDYNQDGKRANICAVILAAGVSSRSKYNKLMAETEDGTPLFMRAVNAALGSDASPVFIVTGHQAEEMQKHLEDIDINVLYNPSYPFGVKTSITLGLKSTPSFCEGAVLIPADMPNITSQDINKLISSFQRGQERQVCMFTHHKEKANPIIWSKSLYAVADLVPENSKVRPIFVEHSDYTHYVEIKNDKKFLDVTYPIDVENFTKKNKG